MKDPKPALNGEPYYAGYRDARGPGSANYTRGAVGGSELDDAFVRSGIYGSFLSGGFAGHVYGAEGIWAPILTTFPVDMWDAFQWRSGAQMQYLRTFAFSIGRHYQDLVPLPDLVSPNKTQVTLGYEGWAYCARTDDKKFFLAYFEKGCLQSQIRGARLKSRYRAQWFNRCNGDWINAGNGMVYANKIGIIAVVYFREMPIGDSGLFTKVLEQKLNDV